MWGCQGTREDRLCRAPRGIWPFQPRGYLLSLKLVGSDDVCHRYHFVPVHGKEVLGNILERTGDKGRGSLTWKETSREQLQSPNPEGTPGIATMRKYTTGDPKTRVGGDRDREGCHQGREGPGAGGKASAHQNQEGSKRQGAKTQDSTE